MARYYVPLEMPKTIFPEQEGRPFTLDELQTLIGGHIEFFPIDDHYGIVCDEDALRKRLPRNMHLLREYHFAIRGPALVVRYKGQGAEIE